MKPWTEMTDREVNRLKREQCRMCKYHKVSNTNGFSSWCDYSGMTGQLRKCDPRDCEKFEQRTSRRNQKYVM